MKSTIVLLPLCLLAVGCHIRQLGCVVCATHTAVDTTTYRSGKIKSISFTKSVGAGMHRNFRHKLFSKEFDSLGQLRVVKREHFITTYHDFGKIMLSADSSVYNAARDSSTRYVIAYKQGKLLKRTVVRSKE